MSFHRIVPGAVALLLGLAALGTAQDSPATDEAKLRALEDRVAARLARGETDLAIALLAEAADLRAVARGEEPHARPAPAAPTLRGRAETALRALERAAARDDAEALRTAAAEAARALRAWQADLDRRERLARLEREVRGLRERTREKTREKTGAKAR